MKESAVSRSVFRAVHPTASVPAALLQNTSGGIDLPAELTEYWIAGEGMFQDSGMTQPVSSAGQVVAKWVGQRGANELTGTNVVAESIGGVLVPRLNCVDAYFALPAAWSTNRRNFSIQFHIQQPGCGPRAMLGLGAIRVGELFTYNTARPVTYDGVTVGSILKMPKVSTCNLHLRGDASSFKVGVNGSETSLGAWAAGTVTGGRIGDLPTVGGVAGNQRIWGISAGPYINDTVLAETLAQWSSFRPVASESAPQENWLAYGDSLTEGYKTSTLDTWATRIADAKPNIRIGHFGWAGAYFIGGVDNATNTAQGPLEKVSGVTNRVIFCGTNDFYLSTAVDYFNAIKTRGQAMQAQGWQAWVWKMPQRASPYTDADPNFNTKVNAFNGLLTSDPWMNGIIDVASIADQSGAKQSDGVHFTSTTQAAIATYVQSLWAL